jgi:hypothetical protein
MVLVVNGIKTWFKRLQSIKAVLEIRLNQACFCLGARRTLTAVAAAALADTATTAASVMCT